MNEHGDFIKGFHPGFYNWGGGGGVQLGVSPQSPYSDFLRIIEST